MWTGKRDQSVKTADGFSISDLRARPGFVGDVADRVWNAWWRSKGVPLEYITGRVQENLVSTGIPLAIVAHHGDRFMGTASLIASDMDERPQYSPWIAAVWVEPECRGEGVGSALVNAAAQAAIGQGIEIVYLCASPANSLFYERMGWQRVETGVGNLNIFSLGR